MEHVGAGESTLTRVFLLSEALYLMMSCRRMRGQWQALCYLQVLDKLGFEGLGAFGAMGGSGLRGLGGLTGLGGGLGGGMGGLGRGGLGRMGAMGAMMGEELEFEMFEF